MLENSDPWKDIPTTNEDEELVVKKLVTIPMNGTKQQTAEMNIFLNFQVSLVLKS